MKSLKAPPNVNAAAKQIAFSLVNKSKEEAEEMGFPMHHDECFDVLLNAYCLTLLGLCYNSVHPDMYKRFVELVEEILTTNIEFWATVDPQPIKGDRVRKIKASVKSGEVVKSKKKAKPRKKDED